MYLLADWQQLQKIVELKLEVITLFSIQTDKANKNVVPSAIPSYVVKD